MPASVSHYEVKTGDYWKKKIKKQICLLYFDNSKVHRQVCDFIFDDLSYVRYRTLQFLYD